MVLRAIGVVIIALGVWVAHEYRREVVVPKKLEPTEGAAQCNYELLRAFAGWIKEQNKAGARLRYTLGAGTLLGAMRSRPAGLLKWEHDVDIYVPARDASEIALRLHRQCESGQQRGQWCDVLQFRGFTERDGKQPCCGFGYKLYHRNSNACELDVLVLALSAAPFLHGKSKWEVHNFAAATPWHWIASWLHHPNLFFVIPEDVNEKLLMGNDARWCKDTPLNTQMPAGLTDGVAAREQMADEWRWCGSVPLSFFQDEYFKIQEFYPIQKLAFYDFEVNIPHNPWALLNRTYGESCSYIAHLNEHGHVEVDLRLPQWEYLRRPAAIKQLGPV